jgi:hypothetical protein
VSKSSTTEMRYWDQLGAYLRDNWVRCAIYYELRALELVISIGEHRSALFPK